MCRRVERPGTSPGFPKRFPRSSSRLETGLAAGNGRAHGGGLDLKVAGRSPANLPEPPARCGGRAVALRRLPSGRKHALGQRNDRVMAAYFLTKAFVPSSAERLESDLRSLWPPSASSQRSHHCRAALCWSRPAEEGGAVEHPPGGSPKNDRGSRGSRRQVALRALLGLAGASLVIGFASGGLLGTLSVVVGGIMAAVVIVLATRSGWML